ncbi:MAG: transposase [Chitinophagales bacterium]|nr:transposase [Chitinophagales bacterium]
MHGHKIINQNAPHFLTMTVVDWLDVFTRQAYRDTIIKSLSYCQKEKGLVINAYVIMSNHLHLIGYARDGYQLSNIIRDFKRFTSRTITKDILSKPEESRSEWMLRLFKYFAKYNNDNGMYQFWQKSNHPIELASPKWILQKLDYIHLNPVRAGWVDEPKAYIYSSARQYSGENGLLPIEILDLRATRGYKWL